MLVHVYAIFNNNVELPQVLHYVLLNLFQSLGIFSRFFFIRTESTFCGEEHGLESVASVQTITLSLKCAVLFLGQVNKCLSISDFSSKNKDNNCLTELKN